MFTCFFPLQGMDVSSMIRAKRRVNSAYRARYAQMGHHRADHLRAWKDYLQIEKDYLRLEKNIYGSKKTSYGLRLFSAE